jgi:hypothetical protein
LVNQEGEEERGEEAEEERNCLEFRGKEEGKEGR